MGSFVGEEELALGREGASEREALARRTSSGYVGREEILGSFVGDDDVIPAFAKTPHFKQTVKERVEGWKLDIERSKRGDDLSRRRVQNGLSSIKRWVDLHRTSKDPEDYGDNYFYWLNKMASSEVPVLRALFARLESSATSSGYNSAWAHIRGEERQIAREALEELRERAKAGDERARRALEKLSKTKIDGDDEGVLTPQFMKTVEKIRPTERRELGKLAAIMQRAAGGDAAAKKKVEQIKRQIGALVAKARGGDASAARAVQILEDSGLFGRSQPVVKL